MVQTTSQKVEMNKRRPSWLVVAWLACFALAIPLATVTLTGGQPNSRHMLVVAASLAIAILAVTTNARGCASERSWRALVGLLLGVGAVLWGLGALGNWAMDSGSDAISRGDYERAVAHYVSAAEVHDAPGVTMGSVGGDFEWRVGLRGIALYPRWRAAYSEAVALYGAGEFSVARRRMADAVRLAEERGASSEVIEWLEAESAKMVLGK